jgi:hypothetical protein
VISAVQMARRILALAFLAFWTGCIAYANPALPPVNCYYQTTPYAYCDAEFVWVPGYWTLGYYGERIWHPGYYRRRIEVRDHRR